MTLEFYQAGFKAMGSPCEIQVFAKNQKLAKRAAEKAIADVQRLEAKYSRYRKDSFLSRINQSGTIGGTIKVDEETAGLLNYAQTCYELSNGLFDITSGVLRRAWKFETGFLPDQARIEQLLETVGWHKLLWQAPKLKFLVPGMEIDFGGIVKEYAADSAATLCQKAGISHGVVNLGGDIKIIGPHPDGAPWNIGIRHPRQTEGLLANLSLKHGALTSSGDYERCIVVDGVRYGHVLNPKTGWPVQHLASVSVIADFCVVAGSASTIAMLKEHEGPAWLEALGLPHLWVDVNGVVGGSLATSLPA